MNEIIASIVSRKSDRAFQQKPIGRAELEEIVLAGMRAPSGRNRHTRRFTVVQDKTRLRSLAAVLGEETGAGASYDFYSPDALILVSDTGANPLAVEDCACALENLFLAANALGIGSVWINQFKGLCGRPAVRAALRALGLPDDHSVWGCAALGYAAARNAGAPRKDDDVAWL